MCARVCACTCVYVCKVQDDLCPMSSSESLREEEGGERTLVDTQIHTPGQTVCVRCGRRTSYIVCTCAITNINNNNNKRNNYDKKDKKQNKH